MAAGPVTGEQRSARPKDRPLPLTFHCLLPRFLSFFSRFNATAGIYEMTSMISAGEIF
jgi:hypothetical protein